MKLNLFSSTLATLLAGSTLITSALPSASGAAKSPFAFAVTMNRIGLNIA